MKNFSTLASADTMVVISGCREYKLHSATLKKCSGTLARLLDGQVPEPSEDGVRYHLVLSNNIGFSSGRGMKPTFRRALHAVSIVGQSEKANIDSENCGYYHKILASFYGIKLSIDTTNVDAAMEDALGLMGCAEYLDCVPMVSKWIDDALVSMGQEIYQAISVAPNIWIELGYRLSSRTIFKEALVHVTGKYHELKLTEGTESKDTNLISYARFAIRDFPTPVKELVVKKQLQLMVKCQNVDKKMGITRHASRRGYSFYKSVSETGMAYLDQTSTNGYRERILITAKPKPGLTKDVDTLKVLGQTYVKPILKNESKLDTGKNIVYWLMCTEVGEDDYPWEGVMQEREEDDMVKVEEDDMVKVEEDSDTSSDFWEFGEGEDLDEDIEDQYKQSRRAVRDDMSKSMAEY